MLRIENPEIIQLANELAERTGETVEQAVETGLREYLARLVTADEEEQRRAEIEAIVKDLGAMFRECPDLVTDHGKLLYGEDGSPK